MSKRRSTKSRFWLYVAKAIIILAALSSLPVACEVVKRAAVREGARRVNQQ